jgi:hypothetical protein
MAPDHSPSRTFPLTRDSGNRRSIPMAMSLIAALRQRLVYWPAQVVYTSIVLVPLWARGLRRVLCDAQLRPAGIAAAAVLGAQFLLGGKPYYPGGIYPLLFAAGSAGLSLTAARATRYCVAGALASLMSLPVLPAAALAFGPLNDIDPEPAEQIGWPGEVTLVLRATFASVREVAVYTNGLGIRNQEEDTPVYVATGLRTTWAAAWPASATTTERIGGRLPA